MSTANTPTVTIKISRTGGYRVEGDITLLDPDGNEIPTKDRKSVVLCRCGASATKPFCDGTHKTLGEGWLQERPAAKAAPTISTNP